MDFDLSKENIQPLRRGRNVHQLEMALHAQTSPEYQQQLQQQKEHFETLIKEYQGDDPLQNYYEYILWIEQTFPKSGHEGNCVSLLEHCLGKFEDDPRYTNDMRFCKLWVKYNDMFPSPEELYLMMKSKNLCTGCAEFYKAWAYYYEAGGDFQKANNIFEEGKRNLAQPYDELELAHKNLITSAGEHMLYGPNEGRLQEKRQALTSLHLCSSGRVNNVRLPSGSANGIGTLADARRDGPNVALNIYEDQASAFPTGGAAPTSIITVAKRQEGPKENTLKPGPWTTVPHKKRVLGTHRPIAAGFTILEDTSEPSGGYLPANLPPVCLEDYSNWNVALQNFPDPPNPNVLVAYPKHLVYSDPNIEYSIEELRAIRYRSNGNSTKNLVRCEEMQPIIVVDDDEDGCVVVAQENQADQENNRMDATPNFTRFEGNSPNQSCGVEAMSTVSHSPWKSSADHQNFLQNVFGESNEHRLNAFAPLKFDILEDPEPERSPFSINVPEQPARGFAIFDQSMQSVPPQAGNAMKTAFRTLNADEVETGSRGGMDGAMAAQPADDAKPMPVPFSDSSSCSLGDDSYCSPQQFSFDLNVMQVSTPQTKTLAPKETPQPSTKIDLFKDKSLSTIIEERSSYRSCSSGSSGTVTKLTLHSHHKNKIGTISEEHNSYWEQNMKANEELRRSLLSGLMEDVLPVVQLPAAPSPIQSAPMATAFSPKTPQPLDYVPADPFNANLISHLLQRVSFPGGHGHCLEQIYGNPKLTVRKQPMYIGNDRYIIEKLLGKGQFGTVFKACNCGTKCTVALKYQKPPNKWEYYICKELQSRLANHNLRDRFMDVTKGYFSDQASILVSQLEPLGSLLATANILKTSFKVHKESIAMYFTLQMLQIVKAMHEVKIIHADIKPDNFLVFPLRDNYLGLRLIDFGCSIDMSLFPEGAAFTVPINTEDFICCEVRDGRPWSYHTDLFCVAATAHVLLLQEYIQLKKNRDVWSLVIHLPRYLVQDLWNMLFSSMLNQQSGPADIATLELLFQEEIDKPSRQKDLRINLISLSNMLKNR
ncbi:hypothetical protein HUJ04_002488 [Dendroctonus ponderosae]|uniref:Protein kinase domain-containing protein n=1 Tax=Dendroctonus ponderosae TaxID=77166 RepID=A0AAR5PKL6_DENPD|nr:hypothetical protein HUJ04_002488 [Dendroctonus ponderosae]